MKKEEFSALVLVNNEGLVSPLSREKFELDLEKASSSLQEGHTIFGEIVSRISLLKRMTVYSAPKKEFNENLHVKIL